MARCSNAELMRKVSLKKLSKEEEFDFTLIKDLPDCRRVKAKEFTAISGEYTRADYARPHNRFECMPKGCTTSGTLNLSAANETVTYQIPGDAREVSAGITTFYVKGTAPVVVTVKYSADPEFTNADQYEITVPAMLSDGYAPVAVDLTQTPTEVGDGWTPAPLAYIQISADKPIGISTLDFFESMEDFELNQTVKLGCMSSVGGTFDVATIEARCAESQYDENLNSLSFPVTASLISSNWLFMNPLIARGKAAEGFTVETIRKAIETYTVGGKTYGRIILTDAAEDCGFYAVQRADGCDADLMVEISIPTLAEFDVNHYQRLDTANGVELIFNADLVGEEMLVSYPRAAEVEEYVASTDNLNQVRVRMSKTYTAEGLNGVKGSKYNFVANNVLITSVPFTVTDQDTSFPFTITILRDNDGAFFHVYKLSV